MTDPTPDLVRAYAAHMASVYRVRIVRHDAFVRAALRLVGMSPDRVATTMPWGVVSLPGDVGDPALWDLWGQIETIAHECQHAHQRAEQGTVTHSLAYLFDRTARAAEEVDAYAVNLELHRWRNGTIAPGIPGHYARALRGYQVSDADVAAAESALRMRAVSARRGVILSHAGRTAIGWLDAHAPSLRHPAVGGRIS